jgi:hypothetical protein
MQNRIAAGWSSLVKVAVLETFHAALGSFHASKASMQ